DKCSVDAAITLPQDSTPERRDTRKKPKSGGSLLSGMRDHPRSSSQPPRWTTGAKLREARATNGPQATTGAPKQVRAKTKGRQVVPRHLVRLVPPRASRCIAQPSQLVRCGDRRALRALLAFSGQR